MGGSGRESSKNLVKKTFQVAKGFGEIGRKVQAEDERWHEARIAPGVATEKPRGARERQGRGVGGEDAYRQVRIEAKPVALGESSEKAARLRLRDKVLRRPLPLHLQLAQTTYIRVRLQVRDTVAENRRS